MILVDNKNFMSFFFKEIYILGIFLTSIKNRFIISCVKNIGKFHYLANLSCICTWERMQQVFHFMAIIA